jgi:hypothetical protein
MNAVYEIVVLAVLQRRVLTDAERQEGRGMILRGFRISRNGEAKA